MRFIYISIFLLFQLTSFSQPGGENCLTATSINSIPFIGIGNTTSANDDYFENWNDNLLMIRYDQEIIVNGYKG